jgi:alkylhydroperoxidase family enzyme
LVAKVREESYKVTDSDIEDLLASGFTEDEVFEITVAAALGAAKRRLDAGLRAMEAGP